MARNTLLIILFLFVGCSHNKYEGSILDQGFGGLTHIAITFLDGPWYDVGSRYGYHIDDNHIKVAYRNDNGNIETSVISIHSCENLKQGINNLKNAVFESSKIALGKKAPTGDPLTTMLDGPSYSLSIYSDEMSGSITLNGGGLTNYRTPWVSSAFEIKKIEEHCRNEN